MIILKVSKKPGFTHYVENTLLKNQRGVQIDSPSHFKVNTYRIIG